MQSGIIADPQESEYKGRMVLHIEAYAACFQPVSLTQAA